MIHHDRTVKRTRGRRRGEQENDKTGEREKMRSGEREIRRTEEEVTIWLHFAFSISTIHLFSLLLFSTLLSDLEHEREQQQSLVKD